MGGFAYDESPVRAKYAGYELPDSDAKISLELVINIATNSTWVSVCSTIKEDKLDIDAGENK